MTHYDPTWVKDKSRERRYCRATAEAVIREAARAGFNLLLLDVKDAVRYRGLPDIRRRYSVPMSELRSLAALARGLGMEVVPKLNFSLSPQYRHSAWLWATQSDFDSPARWARAMTALDEVVAAVAPRRVHVGMDEDDTRSPGQYRAALHLLRRRLKARGLGMMMWADCGHRWRPSDLWKVVPAVESLPRDVALMIWNYGRADAEWAARFVRLGFPVMGTALCNGSAGALGRTRNCREWSDAARRLGMAGVAVTTWTPCSRKNRGNLLRAVRRCGPILRRRA
jgi:hypothetical protein